MLLNSSHQQRNFLDIGAGNGWNYGRTLDVSFGGPNDPGHTKDTPCRHMRNCRRARPLGIIGFWAVTVAVPCELIRVGDIHGARDSRMPVDVACAPSAACLADTGDRKPTTCPGSSGGGPGGPQCCLICSLGRGYKGVAHAKTKPRAAHPEGWMRGTSSDFRSSPGQIDFRGPI